MVLVATYGVDVPYWDTWDWLDRHYPATDATSASPLAGTLARYWAVFNDHRVFVPLLIDRTLLWATGGDMLLRAWLKVPFSLAALWLTLRLAQRTFTREHVMPGWLPPALACLAFPLTYWPMWMDPRQFSVHVVLLATLGALAAASAAWPPARRLAVSGLCCVVASLSYAHGLLTWPAVGVVLLVSRPRPRRAALLAWAACGVLVVALHVVGMQRGQAHVPGAAATDATSMTLAALAVIGMPVAPSLRALGYVPTMTAGLCAVLALAWLAARVWRSDDDARQQALPWLMLAFWGVLTAIVIGRSRGGLPLGALHDPRFAVTTASVWMAGLVLLARVGARRRRRLLVPVLVGLLGVCYAGASLRPLFADGGLGGFPATLASGRACLQSLPTASDACLAQLYPSAARLREIAARLGPDRLRVLREAPPQAGNTEPEKRKAMQQR